ncbi:hypothetical protein A6302_04083 [Methylobrevis pamukkalensis]|uniref:DUF3426 domain-containing protein n=1 Tax=Methylobrevis pamukkalensis TaxID=1439726 RepID=A0A1E3GXF0_9HYPH|nr:hypothetical protein A6302_04083 [Methylobrevis pamukkalensis]
MRSALAVAGFCLFLLGAVLLRTEIVRLLPDLAGVYRLAGLEVNLRGLAIGDVRSYGSADGNGAVLVVEGVISNVEADARPVPALRFGLRNASGREIYAWSMRVPQDRLAPGEQLEFRSQLPTPPEAAIDVVVRFSDEQTLALGVR